MRFDPCNRSISNCGVSDDGVSKLGNMLCRNGTLQELHLDDKIVTHN